MLPILHTRRKLQAGETVVIVGAEGEVNNASAQVAKLSGARVIVVDADANKLMMAGLLGADILIDRSRDEPDQRFHGSNGFDNCW